MVAYSLPRLGRRELLRQATTSGALVVLASACRPGQPSSPAPGPVGRPVKIIYWSHHSATGPRAKLEEELLARFMRENPLITIEYQQPPTQGTTYEDKLLSTLVAGAGPELFNLFDGRAPAFIDKGYCAEIDYNATGFGSPRQLQDLYLVPTALDGHKWKGKYYGIPSELSNYCLHINPTMFRNAGLDVERDWPKTWESMLDVARILTKREGEEYVQRAFDFDYAAGGGRFWIYFGGMAYQLGGPIMSEDGKRPMVNHPGAVQALAYWQDWVLRYRYGSPKAENISPAFQNERASMIILGSWYAPGWRNQYPDLFERYIVKPFPRFRDARYDHGSHNYSYCWMVNSAAPADAQRAAWKVAVFLSNFPAEYLETTGLLQPKKGLEQSAAFKNTKFLDVFLDDMRKSTVEPRAISYAEITASLKRGLERAYVAGEPPKQALDATQQEIEQIIAREG